MYHVRCTGSCARVRKRFDDEPSCTEEKWRKRKMQQRRPKVRGRGRSTLRVPASAFFLASKKKNARSSASSLQSTARARQPADRGQNVLDDKKITTSRVKNRKTPSVSQQKQPTAIGAGRQRAARSAPACAKCKAVAFRIRIKNCTTIIRGFEGRTRQATMMKSYIDHGVFLRPRPPRRSEAATDDSFYQATRARAQSCRQMKG